MSKLPFMKFYPKDWVMSTRILTSEQKGLYIDLICLIWEKGSDGVIRIIDSHLATMWGTDTHTATGHVMKLQLAGVVDVEIIENILKISQKRIAEDLRDLKNDAKRQRKHRMSSHASVTHLSHQNNREKAEGILQKADKDLKTLPKTEFWANVVEHINKTWKAKKGAPFHFDPRRMKALKGLCKTYQPWGVMALWDDFLRSTDDWVRSTGYRFEAFVHSVDKLVDDYSWKSRAQVYENQLHHPVSALPAGSPPDVVKLALDSIKTKI